MSTLLYAGVAGATIIGGAGVWRLFSSSGTDESGTVKVLGVRPSGGGDGIRELPLDGRTVYWERDEDDDGDAIPIVLDPMYARRLDGDVWYWANVETGDVFEPDWTRLVGEDPAVDRIDAEVLRDEQQSQTVSQILTANAGIDYNKLAFYGMIVLVFLMIALIVVVTQGG